MDLGGSIGKGCGTGIGRRGFCKVCVGRSYPDLESEGLDGPKRSMPFIVPGLVAYL